ncbi:MAG: hypothetical protein ABIY55_28325 [Kofleriaceae bacterium]
MMNTANTLRAALKQAGFNARMVTVRERHSTLDITIRDASAALTKVKSIADRFELVTRDHATGEILCGGNVFIRVEYADSLVAPVKATILAVLDPAPNDEYVALPGGYRAMKCTRQGGQGASYVWEVRMSGPGFTLTNDIAVGVGWAAERLAVVYLDASASGEGLAA